MVVAGVGLVTASHAWGESSFGWFAYAPLSESELSFGEQLSRDVRDLWAGIAVAVIGLLMITGGVGYRIGQRRGLAQSEG
jgi:heme/copper-type cytochrome/quinol oxidase subunit 1